MTSAIDVIRRVAGGNASPEDVAWLAARFTDYLRDPAGGLERALWLDRGPGEPGWWTVEARARRDELLRQLRRDHFANVSDWHAADAICAAGRRYLASGWPRDRHRTDPPEGPVNALLWSAMNCGVGLPGGRRQIHDIIRRTDDRRAVAA